jgi:hypothetical protein
MNDNKNVITVKGMNRKKKRGIAREMLSYAEFLAEKEVFSLRGDINE